LTHKLFADFNRINTHTPSLRKLQHLLPLLAVILSASSTAKTLAGLNVLDTSKHRWSDLSGTIHGEQPTPRYSHGFTSAGGKLYLHGGIGNEGSGTVPPIPSNNPY
jgi:hypothetical protein